MAGDASTSTAATTLDDRVFAAMAPYFREKFAATISIHVWGQKPRPPSGRTANGRRDS
jgi:cysteine sulfinate desulfinase/cysteine desulfurase-like protein